MIPIGCGCGGRRRGETIQAMTPEQAQAVLDQQANINPLTASTIVDPDELVIQPH